MTKNKTTKRYPAAAGFTDADVDRLVRKANIAHSLAVQRGDKVSWEAYFEAQAQVLISLGQLA
jgi:hypothetical protein